MYEKFIVLTQIYEKSSNKTQKYRQKQEKVFNFDNKVRQGFFIYRIPTFSHSVVIFVVICADTGILVG